MCVCVRERSEILLKMDSISEKLQYLQICFSNPCFYWWSGWEKKSLLFSIYSSPSCKSSFSGRDKKSYAKYLSNISVISCSHGRWTTQGELSCASFYFYYWRLFLMSIFVVVYIKTNKQLIYLFTASFYLFFSGVNTPFSFKNSIQMLFINFDHTAPDSTGLFHSFKRKHFDLFLMCGFRLF